METLVLHGYAPAILERIRDKAVELAIWERELPKGFADWLDALPAENLPDARGRGSEFRRGDVRHRACRRARCATCCCA